MPKYIADKVFGHYLYFTSFCTIEAMLVFGFYWLIGGCGRRRGAGPTTSSVSFA